MDDQLGSQFDTMQQLGLLDLDNRKGKAPGGYQSTLDEVRLPFIFMNAVGGQRRAHIAARRRTCLSRLRRSFAEIGRLPQRPMEFSEVASMAMELLGSPHIDEFYDGDDLVRARREFLEDIISYLPGTRPSTSSSRWVYTHKGHGVDERLMHGYRRSGASTAASTTAGWKRSNATAGRRRAICTGYRSTTLSMRSRRSVPLQVWLNAKQDRPNALKQYRHALSLGGNKPLPELFRAAGGRFGMDAETLKPLVAALEEEIESIEPKQKARRANAGLRVRNSSHRLPNITFEHTSVKTRD